MLISMKKDNLKFKFFFLFLFINYQTTTFSEVMILTGCKNIKDNFVKNEYILDLKKSLMTRNYVYDSKTFKKLKLTDLSVSKKNTIERFIYEDNDLILTDKIGYPQFYTQLVFERNNLKINIKTVINNEEAFKIVSTCKKIEIFDNES
jgi:hypothetical protein